MARLLLIRHGQASFLADDYDVLSPLGEEQARRLGAHLASAGQRPDRVLVGPLRRQRHTAALAAEGSGGGWPEPIELPGLREHQGDQLLREHLPALAEASPALAALVQQAAAATDAAGRSRAVALLLEATLRRWSSGDFDALVEPFASFQERTRQALAEATRDGRLVAVFTSGGVIGAMTAHALGSPAATAVDLGTVVYHTALCEFLFSPGRLSLLRFNATPHLDAPALTQR